MNNLFKILEMECNQLFAQDEDQKKESKEELQQPDQEFNKIILKNQGDEVYLSIFKMIEYYRKKVIDENIQLRKKIDEFTNTLNKKKDKYIEHIKNDKIIDNCKYSEIILILDTLSNEKINNEKEINYCDIFKINYNSNYIFILNRMETINILLSHFNLKLNNSQHLEKKRKLNNSETEELIKKTLDLFDKLELNFKLYINTVKLIQVKLLDLHEIINKIISLINIKLTNYNNIKNVLEQVNKIKERVFFLLEKRQFREIKSFLNKNQIFYYSMNYSGETEIYSNKEIPYNINEKKIVFNDIHIIIDSNDIIDLIKIKNIKNLFNKFLNLS